MYKKTLFTAILLLLVLPVVTNAGILDLFQGLFSPSQEVVLGGPDSQSTRNIYPFTDSAYEIGTSTKAYLRGTFDILCLTGDSCETTWPAGGSGGGIATSSPWTALDLVQVVDDETVKSIATSSLGLPTFTSLDSYLSLSSWYATTTDGLDQGSTNLYNQTHTGEVTGATGLTIADNVVDEANLKLDTGPTNGYLLSASSTASGGLDWVATSTLGFSAGSSEWTDAGSYVYPNEGDYAEVPYINATSTTATSTFSGEVLVGPDTHAWFSSTDGGLASLFFDTTNGLKITNVDSQITVHEDSINISTVGGNTTLTSDQGIEFDAPVVTFLNSAHWGGSLYSDTSGVVTPQAGTSGTCVEWGADGTLVDAASAVACGAGGSSEWTDGGGFLYPNEDDEVRATFFTSSSTSATSTFPNASFTQILIGSDYLTELVGTGLSVAAGTLSTTLGTAITSSEITDNEIIEPDLSADNGASDGDILTYDSTGTNFAWITQNAGTDITADLEEEVTEGSLANDTIVEADLKAVDAAGDEECLTFESTVGDFEWQTCGSGSSLFTDDGLFTYLTSTTDDLVLGGSATATAPFWWDVSATSSYIGTGGTGDSDITFGQSGNEWIAGFDDTDDSFAIASSTVLGTQNLLQFHKNGDIGFGFGAEGDMFGVGTTTPSVDQCAVGGNGTTLCVSNPTSASDIVLLGASATTTPTHGFFNSRNDGTINRFQFGTISNHDDAFFVGDAMRFLINATTTGSLTGQFSFNDYSGSVSTFDTDPEAFMQLAASGRNALSDVGLSENYMIEIDGRQAVNGSGMGIAFNGTASDNNITAGIIAERVGSNGQGNLHFYTKQSATASVDPVLAMTIDENGRLGIGSSAPTTPLYIQANDNTVAQTVLINAAQANVTAADTYIDFRSTTGSEGSIAGTAVAGVLAYNTFTGSHYTQIIDKTGLKIGMVLESIDEKVSFDAAQVSRIDEIYTDGLTDTEREELETLTGKRDTEHGDNSSDVQETQTERGGILETIGAVITDLFTQSDEERRAALEARTTAPVRETIIITEDSDASPKTHLAKAKISDKEGSKAVYGVYGGTDAEGRDLVLSLGTGVILAANKGENIEIGDFLMTSDVRGYAEKQVDGICRNITVAKARESVVWNVGETGRLISVTYKCE